MCKEEADKIQIISNAFLEFFSLYFTWYSTKIELSDKFFSLFCVCMYKRYKMMKMIIFYYLESIERTTRQAHIILVLC